MAVIKHISVKGSNGGDALNYVLYKHNEKTGEIIYDCRGNPVMRDEYYLDGINCEPYSFAAECKEVNDLYGKNQLQGDIKAHHFIISYDPKDGVDHGLTGPKAQQLSMEWAERCLPGFQILVCTHMDGSNESGNIHTHIMMNSVRKCDTKPEMYGERDIDHKAGYKLHLTDDYLRYMKQELMNICEREGLHQIDLISPAKDRITDKEYHAQQNGQHHLEKQHVTDGGESEKTVFQTQKQYLRESVMDVASRATSFDSFCMIMKEEYNITVKESRGRISYLHPDREKYITGKTLGTIYEKESVMQIIDGKREVELSEENKEKNTTSFTTATIEDCKKIFEMNSDIRLVVQLQDCAKHQTSTAYMNEVTLNNVKVMAKTILFVQQNEFESVADLESELKSVQETITRTKEAISKTQSQLIVINDHIHYLGLYLETKEVHKQYVESKNKQAFMQSNKRQMAMYNKSIDYLKKRYGDKSFPSMMELKYQKQSYTTMMTALQKKQEYNIQTKDRLSLISNNIKIMLGNKDIRMSRFDSEKKNTSHVL